MNILNKIFIWIRINAATILGLSQAALKAIKEILTGVINLLSLFIRTASAQAIVIKTRDFINRLDILIENWKVQLLKVL